MNFKAETSNYQKTALGKWKGRCMFIQPVLVTQTRLLSFFWTLWGSGALAPAETSCVCLPPWRVQMTSDLLWVLDLPLLADSPGVYLVVDKLSVKSIFSLNLVSKRGTWVTLVERAWEGFAQLKDTDCLAHVERHWEDFITYRQNLYRQVLAQLEIKGNLIRKVVKLGFFLHLNFFHLFS